MSSIDYKVEIGKRIKEARYRLAYSLVDLSKRTEGRLSASRISNYEQGIRMPGPEEVQILAQALETDPAYLMCLETVFTHRAIQMMKDWQVLSESEQLAVLQLVATLKNGRK